jgi:3-hydroxybutyryl-CoA dehydrogenase
LKGRILIVGSGKMARNVGLFFAGQGYATSFVSRDGDRLRALEGWARRRLRRFAALGAGPEAATFHLAPTGSLPPAELVLEAVEEQTARKRQALASLPAAALAHGLLLSISSSILPSEIHPDCVGLHFFYPVELTRFAELVLPAGTPAARREQLLALVAQSGLDFVEQDERAAFAVNQLLLPLQAECMQALRNGCSSAELDDATRSPLLPMGQLSLMDTIGLDVVLPAVRNYLDRLAPELRQDLEPLAAGLGTLGELGKRGNKNGDGLCCGAPLPWPLDPRYRPEPASLRRLFLNSCVGAADRGLVGRAALDRVLRAVFGAVVGFEEALAAEDPVELRSTLESLFIRTGRWYFSPAPSLVQRRA